MKWAKTPLVNKWQNSGGIKPLVAWDEGAGKSYTGEGSASFKKTGKTCLETKGKTA